MIFKTKNNRIWIVFCVVFTLFTIGCITPTEDSQGGKEDFGGGTKGLIKALGSSGLDVEEGDSLSLEAAPFFSVKGMILNLNGSSIQLWEYPDADSAEREAGRISPDGFGYVDESSGTAGMISWVDMPNFFRSENLIVLYVGSDKKIIGVLGEILGEQFAGGATSNGGETFGGGNGTFTDDVTHEAGYVGPIPFENLIKGVAASGPKDASSHVVKDKGTWEQVLNITATRLDPQEIDFEKYTVIASFAGMKGSGGHSLTITSITELEDKIKIYVTVASPGEGCMTTTQLTSPYQIVRTEKLDKKIEFVIRSEERPCVIAPSPWDESEGS